jgi:hypothetical protein
MIITLEWMASHRFWSKRSLPVQLRVVRMNPLADPGTRIRGYFPKPLSWRKAKKRIAKGEEPFEFRMRGGRGYYGVYRYPECGPLELQRLQKG